MLLPAVCPIALYQHVGLRFAALALLSVLVVLQPLFGGAQLAIDATLVSPLGQDGGPRHGAEQNNGAALRAAATRTARTYPELAAPGGRPRLVVLAVETGGRWSNETWHLLRLLATAKTRAAPRLLQRSAELGWRRRWSSLLGVTAQRALAESLLYPAATAGLGADGDAPSLTAVLEDAKYVPALQETAPEAEQEQAAKTSAALGAVGNLQKPAVGSSSNLPPFSTPPPPP